jgi:hypothetical protein
VRSLRVADLLLVLAVSSGSFFGLEGFLVGLRHLEMSRSPRWGMREEHRVDFCGKNCQFWIAECQTRRPTINRQSCGLRNTEEDEDGGRGDKARPDKGDLGTDGSLDDGRDESDNDVHTPCSDSCQCSACQDRAHLLTVCSRSDSDTLGGETSREHFSGNNPSDRTDSARETK